VGRKPLRHPYKGSLSATDSSAEGCSLAVRAVRGDDRDERIAALVDRHGAALLRVARQHSLCLDDAQDAYQRALEIYLRRLGTIDAATEGPFMKVVVRHEAMAVRRARAESVNGEDIDFDTQADSDLRALEDRLASAERSARSAEVLRRLKPDEATALLLKAEGHSYGEIGARQGWTYTKVNRAITEGRRRFLKAYADLEAGEGCERFRPALQALANGSASADSMLELRPHLRHCPACRATVRELRGGRRRAAAWLPVPAFLRALLPGRDRGRVDPPPLDYAENIVEAGGTTDGPLLTPGRFTELKLHLQGLAHRLNGSEVAASVQLAGSSGGGRGLSVAAMLGICVSSLGAGTVCVVTLVSPERQPPVHRAEPVKRAHPVRKAVVEKPPTAVVVFATPTPVPTRRHRQAATPRTSRTPASSRHEDSGPAAPAVVGQQEFAFESAAPSGGTASASAQPAAAPATGGDEFTP
jgi:RNA polymerase sigma factor (sigma-70 family)